MNILIILFIFIVLLHTQHNREMVKHERTLRHQKNSPARKWLHHELQCLLTWSERPSQFSLLSCFHFSSSALERSSCWYPNAGCVACGRCFWHFDHHYTKRYAEETPLTSMHSFCQCVCFPPLLYMANEVQQKQFSRVPTTSNFSHPHGS